VLVEFLHENRDIFAWKPSDIPSVPRELAKHKLHIDPKARPVKQSLRPFNVECHHAIGEEFKRLLAAGFIRVIKHPKLVANPVLVLNKNKTWRMCIDYTNLNSACPKEEFVLPWIDHIIDSTAGSESLYFLDAYSGYNQIKMAAEDEEKWLSSRCSDASATPP
jgi:hypothetical protein